MSLLRRSACCIVYTDTPNITLNKSSETVTKNNESFCWKQSDSVPMFILRSRDTPQASAIEICKEENKIFNSLHAGIHIYTIFFGPEEYTSGERIVRIGIARGIHRY